MLFNESDAKIADIITDGCNMGIKSLNKYFNQYKAADDRSYHHCICLNLNSIFDGMYLATANAYCSPLIVKL